MSEKFMQELHELEARYFTIIQEDMLEERPETKQLRARLNTMYDEIEANGLDIMTIY